MLKLLLATLLLRLVASLGLNEAAQAAGKLWFGTAVSIPGPQQNDDDYMAEFTSLKDFGGATPAACMKFTFTEPHPGQFDFTDADEFLKLAKGKKVRCHNLIWHQELPNWLTQPSVPWNNATLGAVLVRHVHTLVQHFGDACYSWDVVNEALGVQHNAQPTNYTSSIWHRVIGPEFVPMAFEAAQAVVAKHNLEVKLYYNDYALEVRP